MKIIQCDNFDRDTVSDIVIAEYVNSTWAPRIAELLNDKYSGDKAATYFRAVNNDHQLYEASES